MHFGNDSNGIRTRPTYSGQKASCPLCNGNLIGKCGEIYVWHWQHHHNRECDPWKEHETEWHRKWKSYFPDNCQEVIIEKYGEKHIADIKTENGLIIEFQNSSISKSTIRIREDFYKKMIWVINAQSFKEHFKFISIVNSKLRGLDSDTSYKLSFLGKEYDKDIEYIRDRIIEIQNQSKRKHESIKSKNKIIEKLKECRIKFEDFSNKVIDKWSNGDFYWDSETHTVIERINTDLKNQLKNNCFLRNKLIGEIQIKEKKIEEIEQLETYFIDNKSFRIVKYERIRSEDFPKARAILKSSRNTLFHEITSFKNEYEFLVLKYKKDTFDFALDVMEKIDYLKSEIEVHKNEILELAKSLNKIKEEIKIQLLIELENKIQTTECEVLKLEDEWDDLIKQESILTERQARLKEEQKEVILKSKIEIEIESKNKRFQIMKEKKGQYYYEWKHERKSWLAAESPIYFDIGENYLFEKISPGTFKKTLIIEFLEKNLLAKKSK